MAKRKAAKKKPAKKTARKTARKTATKAAASATVKVAATNDQGLVRITVTAGKQKREGLIAASNQIAVYAEIGRLCLDAMGRL